MLAPNGNLIEELQSWTNQQTRRPRLIEEWVNAVPRVGETGRDSVHPNLTFPDAWIDGYVADVPQYNERGNYRGSFQTTLEPYDGSAMKWFGWISIFKALVHDTNKTAAEKLAILQQHLK